MVVPEFGELVVPLVSGGVVEPEVPFESFGELLGAPPGVVLLLSGGGALGGAEFVVLSGEPRGPSTADVRRPRPAAVRLRRERSRCDS